MARALLKPEGADAFTFRDGRYQYVVSNRAPQPTYSVTDGQATISAPIVWSFGAGIAGQTWIYEYQGQLHESRVSYYSKINGLDLTIGASGSAPNSLEIAAGRKMSSQDVAECFGCHSTGGNVGTRFDLQKMIPGVQCAACHVNSQKHAISMSRKEPRAALPPSLARATAEEMNELCGSVTAPGNRSASMAHAVFPTFVFNLIG